eukprot:7160417-Prymnesium_polylepis.1
MFRPQPLRQFHSLFAFVHRLTGILELLLAEAGACVGIAQQRPQLRRAKESCRASLACCCQAGPSPSPVRWPCRARWESSSPLRMPPQSAYVTWTTAGELLP